MSKQVAKTFSLHSIRMKLFLLAAVVLICSFAVLGYQESRTVTRIIEGEALVKAQSDLLTGMEIIDLKYPGPWRVEGGNLYKGDTLMNNNFEIVDLISELTHGDTVTIFLGDTRVATTVLADGERAVGTQASDIVRETVLERGEIYLGQANVVGNTYQTAYMPIKDEAGNIIGMWYVGAPDASERIQALKRNIAFEIVWQALLILAFALLLNFLFSLPLLKRIERATNALGAMADGDLSGSELKVRNRDETGRLTRSVNKLKQDLHEIISQIRYSSEQLFAASEQMLAGAEQTSTESERIANAIQEVATGSERQLAEIGWADQVVAEISAGMNQASQLIESVTQFSLAADERAKSGAEKVTSAVEQMDRVQQTFGEAAEVINRLGRQSEAVGQIVQVMTDIAEQTHLLSLNAEIEAAHAGEHGRGFAVVADEVRKLAEQSAKHASEIAQLIGEVQREALRAVLCMNNGMEVVREGLERVHETGQVFDEIAGTVGDMSSRFQEVSDIVNQVRTEACNIVRMMERISDISRKTSGNAQEVATAAAEQANVLEEVVASAESLGRTAEHLQQLIQRFKL